MSVNTVGVGIIGAGPVTQAIHLPTILRLADLLHVRWVADVDPGVAQRVASRANARSTTDVEDILSDPEVEIVVIASPHRFHAAQIIAAADAGKKAILCEKPLATTEQELADIQLAVERTGTRIVVGAMLAYDPAWRAASQAWRELNAPALYCRSTIFLPSNDRYISLATDPLPTPSRPALNPSDPAHRIEILSNAILGLATHALPQVRAMMPGLEHVIDVRLTKPWGYAVTLSDGKRVAQLSAVMPGSWAPSWTFESWSDLARLQMDSPPSFVHAGSSVVDLVERETTRSWRSTQNGYESEWRHLAALARGDDRGSIPISDSISDLRVGLAIIDAARAAEGVQA